MLFRSLDYTQWQQNKSDVLEELKEIQKLINQESEQAKLVMFFHKVDLIPEDSRDDQIKRILEEISKGFDLPIYFTSIYPNLIYNLYSAFYDVLGNLSDDTARIKDILDEKIMDLSQTMIFITNENNNIVVQTMTPDFEFNLIYYIHEMIGQLNDTFTEMKADDKIEHFTLQTVDEFNIVLKNISHSKHQLQNLICISNDLNANKLIFMLGKLSRDIYNYYYKNKK